MPTRRKRRRPTPEWAVGRAKRILLPLGREIAAAERDGYARAVTECQGAVLSGELYPWLIGALAASEADRA